MLRIPFLFLICILSSPSVNAALLYQESWENYQVSQKNVQDSRWKRIYNGYSNYNQIVSSPVRAGNKAIKFYLTHKDFRHYRESVSPRQTSGRNYEFKIGEEYWLGFSIYLPSNYAIDKIGSEVHMQFHDVPDTYLNEAYRNPCIALDLKQSNWIVQIRWDESRRTPSRDEVANSEARYDGIATFNLGRWHSGWTDFVFHFKLSYNRAGNGFVQAWEDGQPVINYSGPNCYNDAVGPYLMLGPYKASWMSQNTECKERTVYFDEIRIGDRNSSYDEVAP